MHWLKLTCRCLIVISWLALNGTGIEAQVFAPSSYTFVEVTDEAGSPIEGAAVVIYNASGEEIRHWVSDDAGRVHIVGYNKHGLTTQEPWLGNSDNNSYVLRIVKSGRLTYESALGRNLADKLSSQSLPADVMVKVELVHRRKSKINGGRTTPGQGNRPP